MKTVSASSVLAKLGNSCNSPYQNATIWLIPSNPLAHCTSPRCCPHLKGFTFQKERRKNICPVERGRISSPPPVIKSIFITFINQPFTNEKTVYSLLFHLHPVIRVIFEGKMRAMFGMIFGAGILLFVSKKEQMGEPAHGFVLSPHVLARFILVDSCPFDIVGKEKLLVYLRLVLQATTTLNTTTRMGRFRMNMTWSLKKLENFTTYLGLQMVRLVQEVLERWLIIAYWRAGVELMINFPPLSILRLISQSPNSYFQFEIKK